MSITRMAVLFSSWMNQVSPKSQEENEVIQYGIELLLDNVVKFIFIQLIGVMIGQGMETFLILAAFCGLRLQAGGIHAKTGYGCGFSMILIWAFSLIGHLYFPIASFFIPYIYVVSFIVISIFAPRTINIEFFDKKDILKKKLYSIAVLTIIMAVAILHPSIRELLIYPVILEVLTLFPKNKSLKRREQIMKKKVVKELQKAFVKVSLNSVGRSIPAGVYERKIPDEVLKMRDAK